MNADAHTGHDDKVAMWCDLLLANLHAESERFHVTRRAEIYMRAAGLPLDRVLDALGIDEASWRRRVAEARENESRNRAIHDRARQAENGLS